MVLRSPGEEEWGVVEHPAAESRSSGSENIEEPSPQASLSISLAPVTAWGSAQGKVPSGEARHLIAILGILGSTVAGVGAAVLTLNISHTLTGLALAELGLALIAAALIALVSRSDSRDRRSNKRSSNAIKRRKSMPEKRLP